MAAVATLEDYGSDVPEVDSNPLGVYYVAILYPIKAYSTKRCAIDIIKFCGFSLYTYENWHFAPYPGISRHAILFICLCKTLQFSFMLLFMITAMWICD